MIMGFTVRRLCVKWFRDLVRSDRIPYRKNATQLGFVALMWIWDDSMTRKMKFGILAGIGSYRDVYICLLGWLNKKLTSFLAGCNVSFGLLRFSR
jgi:hypothetical protein